jgi:hypothetical protein
MTDRKKGANSDKFERAKSHLDESIAIGRINRFEAEVIKHFFESVPSADWPSSGLQKRMQASGDRKSSK